MTQPIENYETVSAVAALYSPFNTSRPTLHAQNQPIKTPEWPDPIIYENTDQTDKNKPNWRLKLTIPKPFKMTLRDDTSEKSKPCKRVQPKLTEESEIRKTFRANPVPPATFFPIYADMLRQDEVRRKLRKQQCRQVTLALQQPFDFYYREEVNKLFSAKSMPDLTQTKHRTSMYSRNKTLKCRNTTDFTLRNIRATVRASGASGDWNWFVKWSANQSKANLPKRKLDPPDFARIHSRLEKKAQDKLPVKMTTVCEPFALHTGLRRKVVRRDEVGLKESRWPFAAPRTQLGSSSGGSKLVCSQTGPPKLNLAAKLRVENSNKQMARRNEEENKNRVWKNVLRRCVSAKIAAERDYETDEERLKRKRAAVKSRFVNYQQELNEIIERVASRPLLMEQQTTMAARKRAERIFLDKLHANGLTEELIVNKSSLPL